MCGGTAAAQEALRPLHARSSVGAAMMVSADQAGRLGYDRVGLVGDLRLGYALLPWFGLHVAAAGGAFAAADRTGGLLAPAAGLFALLPGGALEPYAFVQVGSGYTGTLARPLLQLGAGLDFALGRSFGIGPALGYGQLFQSNASRNSTDARYVWAGLSCAFRPFAAPAPAPRERLRVRRVTRTVYLPPHDAPPRDVAPSAELLELIERALPSSKTELLAPVLFRFDADQLEPVGVAMLHEVTRELAARPELLLLEIQGYADSRGSDDYNVQLSARRAERVRAWLIEHGVAPERLRTAPEGASAFVEQGGTEDSHQQNRRVVFRVIQTRQP